MLLSTAKIILKFGCHLFIQRKYLQKNYLPFIKQLTENNDGSFHEENEKKMRFYALVVPAIARVSFSIMIGRRMNSNERWKLTQLSAASHLFDDYFDDASLSETRLKSMITQPESFEPSNTKEKVFIHLLRDIKSKVKKIDLFNEVCLKVFEAQMESKKQEKTGLTTKEIYQITFDKGGYATLLFSSVLEQEPLDGEREAIYHLGGMMQWTDDLFDTYEDTKAGLHTLSTPEADMIAMSVSFQEQIKEMKRLFYKLPIERKKVTTFLNLQMLFFSLTMVCLEQLKSIQIKSNTLLFAKNHTRKELVCDMEKVNSILKWMGQYFKMVRL